MSAGQGEATIVRVVILARRGGYSTHIRPWKTGPAHLLPGEVLAPRELESLLQVSKPTEGKATTKLARRKEKEFT